MASRPEQTDVTPVRGFTRRSILAAGAGAALWLLDPGVAPALADAHEELPPEDGRELWLRYRPVLSDARMLEYHRQLTQVVRQGEHPILGSAEAELVRGLSALLGRTVPAASTPSGSGSVVLGTRASSPAVASAVPESELADVGPEGFVLRWAGGRDGGVLVVAGGGERGVLYGAFHLLRLVQTEQRLAELDVRERPANALRLHNHWDNINDTVERGYAGASIFQWSVPGLSPLVHGYARSMASLGLNRTVVNNVNANPRFLTPAMLDEVALVADALRPWGVRLMLSANFASPIVLGGLPDADPLDPAVAAWWRDKADEIYEKIPDFGGFLVKANSEGQPGPTNYGRTHAEGANVIADAVAPHGGLVIWRAFVYDLSDGDVSTDAYDTFKPLDGQFADNALVQAKYGPVDFHVREPVHPLFGGLPNSRMTLELQVTQEHVGHSTHLCYLVPWWKQVLDFDIHADGPGTTVAKVVAGESYGAGLGGLSGVSNFGDATNWTGHHLAAANAYGFGRLAWDPTLEPAQITREWLAMTFGARPALVRRMSEVLLGSWAVFERYTSPLGIGNLVNGSGGHYDPAPETGQHSDAETVGNDRTVATGTGYTGLYHEPWRSTYESLETVPDELILFMHRVPYEHRLHSGKTVIQHIYDSHFTGLEEAYAEREAWLEVHRWVDDRRHAETVERFDAQMAHATVWRDTIVGYFFRLSRILDEQRAWIQVELAAPNASLVLGGWPNEITLEIGNASAKAVDVTARLVVPEGWTAQPTTGTVAAREFEVVDLPVTPEPEGTIVPMNVDARADGLPVLGSGSGTLVVAPAGPRCVLALDAGSATSPLLSGYERLAPQTMWDPERGFGWVGSSPQQRDRGSGLDELRRDFCADTVSRTLRIALPAGSFPAYLLIGDVVDSRPTVVEVDGAEVARSRVLAGNEFEWLRFTLDGGAAGRTVDLRLSGVAGEYWHLGALAVVDPDSVLPEIVVTGSSAGELVMLPERPADVVFELRNTTDAEVTVTPEVAASAGYRASVNPPEVTLPAGAHAEVAVKVVREAAAGNGELSFTVAEQTTVVRLTATENFVRIATLSASSTHPVSSPALAGDGNTDSEQWGNGTGGWNDGTAAQFPDSLAATWDSPVSLRRVRVVTLDSRAFPASSYGLRDYDVQVQVGGQWRTVAEVRGNTAGVVESTFPTQETTALRLLVHDSNDHGYSRVMELEAYA